MTYRGYSVHSCPRSISDWGSAPQRKLYLIVSSRILSQPSGRALLQPNLSLMSPSGCISQATLQLSSHSGGQERAHASKQPGLDISARSVAYRECCTRNLLEAQLDVREAVVAQLHGRQVYWATRERIRRQSGQSIRFVIWHRNRVRTHINTRDGEAETEEADLFR